MSDLNFSSLLTDNSRESDQFINATAWCKSFGKRWTDFRETAGFDAFLLAAHAKISSNKLESSKPAKGRASRLKGAKNGLIESMPGKGGGTWVHPLIAIKLAEWLSPEFDVHVKETFKRFIEAPEEFAANILIASHNKTNVDRAKNRILCSETNKQTATIAHMSGLNIGKVHNDRYNGLYRKTASQLRAMAGLKDHETPLDVMSSRDLQMNGLANTLALEANDADLLFDFANDIKESYEKRMKKPLSPMFEERLLRPNQARAIAFKPEYQTELPVSC
jgi:hypothetical protein